MPFKSSSQMRAAFGGYLGPEMKSKAKSWAGETPNISKLPKHVAKGMRADHTNREIHRQLTGK